MKTTLMVIEGVLRKVMGGAPIPEGIRLYKSLCSTGRVILLSVVETDGPERDEMNGWLEMNGLVQHDLVSWGDVGPRESLANMYRREGYDVDLIVDPDPAIVEGLIKAGFNTLLFTHAAYSVPDWRPDSAKGVRAWDSIQQQVADVARMKAKDARLSDGD